MKKRKPFWCWLGMHTWDIGTMACSDCGVPNERMREVYEAVSEWADAHNQRVKEQRQAEYDQHRKALEQTSRMTGKACFGLVDREGNLTIEVLED
jgi:hypothetical protein